MRTLAFLIAALLASADAATAQPRLHLIDEVEFEGFGEHGSTVLSPCGDRALARHGARVAIWDVASGRRLASFDAPVGDSSAVAIASDCERAAFAGAGGMVWTIDLRAGRPSQGFDLRTSVTALAFQPGRHVLAAATGGGVIVIMDAADGRHLAELVG
ncbi:MAG TPA: hypothetical protein VEL28_00420 [Candidatus Binatia bacterium]|nr:hypothetical protein [Candidatus Binatia bacterium]